MLHCGHLFFISVCLDSLPLCECGSSAALLALTRAGTPTTSNPITSGPGCTTFQLLDASDYHSSSSHFQTLTLLVILSLPRFDLKSFIGDLCCFSWSRFWRFVFYYMYHTCTVRAPHLSLKWFRNDAAKDTANMLRIWEDDFCWCGLLIAKAIWCEERNRSGGV